MDKAHLIIYLAVLASIVSVLITCCLLYLIRDRLSKMFSKNTLLKIKKFLKENVKDVNRPLDELDKDDYSFIKKDILGYV
ncbi:hypothetical protein A0M39_02595 [Campylobacter jejuni]|uniref:hypothetical protein n=1 Tax=Campylobacter TaxID=194 RepID=UPI00087549B4|nr:MULTISPECIES: hypothetical protein [Campylobacter]PCM55691.1 hypothetical protein CP502_12825 [Campylobacter sp. BCW_8712]EAL0243241.1 hypothetical protein [Campylobacter jejuni]MGG43545.1 hypothetical protein [Campylobacter jejuni]OEV66088.1 hypothetical protein AJY73_02845 [Campylobacter jejuni]OKY05090.1 hypothetical protein A0M39_02595 [Campylobacter jejuni]